MRHPLDWRDSAPDFTSKTVARPIGRPRTVRPATGDLLSRGPRMEVMLDADADLALIRLRAETKRPKAECVRLLLRAWNEDTGMKRAFDGWRKGAGK